MQQLHATSVDQSEVRRAMGLENLEWFCRFHTGTPIPLFPFYPRGSSASSFLTDKQHTSAFITGIAGMHASGAAGPAGVAAAAATSRLPQAAPLTKHKVVFLGDQGTGKTTMIKAFMYGTFEQTYKVGWGSLTYARAASRTEAAPAGDCWY